MTKPKVLASIVLAGILGVLALPVLAQSATAPPVQMRQAFAYQNVLEQGDAMVTLHYAMPAVDWATYGADAAVLSLQQDGTVFQTRTPGAIGEYVSAFYLAPGHGLVFGSATNTIDVEIESSPTVFSTLSDADLAATQRTTTGLMVNNATDQNTACTDLLAMSDSVEELDPAIDDGDWVQQGQLTIEASAAWTGAFATLPAIVPPCFVSGLEGGMSDFDPNEEQLETQLTDDVEASAAWGRWETLASAYGFGQGVGPETMAGMLGFALSCVVGFGAAFFSRSPAWGVSLGGLTMLAVAVNVPQDLLQIIFVIATVLAIGPVAWLTARLRT